MAPGLTTCMLVASFPDSVLQFRGPLMAAMRKRGLAVHVAVPGLSELPALRGELTRRGIKMHEIPLQRAGTNPLGDLRTLLHLWWLMRSIAPDLVLAYTAKPVIYGSLAAWMARVPRRYALITGLGYAFQGHGRRGAMRAMVQRLYALALARVHKVFFQNPDDQLLFRQRGLIRARTPSVVINGSGVDTAAYPVTPIPAGPPRFLMIGRLLGDKGVREYVRASRQVRALYPEVECVLVGWADENPDAVTPAELVTWQEEACVEFLGRLEDVRPAIARCTVYVLPSYREGTPRTVLEAMAMGRAIITSDAPGCRETVIHGDNGFLVEPGSVDALAVAMLRFVHDPELAAPMGRRSRLIAEEKYDVRKVNEVMLREMEIAVPEATGTRDG